jgi:hypothetical protein
MSIKKKTTEADIPKALHDRLRNYDNQIRQIQQLAENMLQGYIYSLDVETDNVNFDIETGKITFG